MIYAPPEEFPTPKFQSAGQDIYAYFKAVEDWRSRLSDWARSISKDEFAGTILQFPVADGYASYLIVSLKPKTLVHLDDGDAWHYPHIHRLTAKDLRQAAERERRLNSFRVPFHT